MEKRLVKIAKELNVGTTTIVEHLKKSGFEIENKPTAKVSEEMEKVLVKEFQKSIDIKEKADKLIIGTRPAPKKEEHPPLTIFKTEEKAVPPKPEPPKKETVDEKPEIKPEPKPKIGLTIKGKIDLDAPKAKAKAEEVTEAEEAKAEDTLPVKDEPKVEHPQKEETPEPELAEDDVPADVEKQSEFDEEIVNELTRAETPQLKGLKILGKIDTKKFEGSKPVKQGKKGKKEEVSPASKGESKKTDAPQHDKEVRPKRKRTRKKVPSFNAPKGGGEFSRSGAGGQPGNRNLPPRESQKKEVSKKEIDEKIKQTLATLTGGGKRKRQRLRRDNRDRIREKQELIEAEKETGKLQLTEFVSVSELASLMNIPVTDVITTCMNLGEIVSINQRLDAGIIEVVASEFGHEVEFISAEEQLEDEEEIIDNPEDLEPRAPIVTVMGHVDHGKTSLLDYIRKTNVIGEEAGGITQHIGAYEVLVGKEEKSITFLDTPGHEAFTAMRARGAKVTDIAVIIISADDNIMPQTKEAISHAQAAGVPIVFAINKIDKEGAQPEKIKQELASMNLLVEEWGGEYQSQDISAKVGTNVDELLEKILLQAELLELKANPKRLAIGTVIEASLDKGRGFVTKILVQNGTLNIGDSIVAGPFSGKIKAMFNERGKKIKDAGPSKPVLILGLNGAPQAGEKFKETELEQEARQIASKRAQISREQANRASKRISLDEIGRRLALGTFKELNLIVKGDVDGSIEALSDSLIKLSIEKVQVKVIHKAVGQIIESDVLLASASDAIIIGFQVRPSLGARKLAEREGVQIKTYSIIYEAIEEIKMAIEGMLEPTKEEKITAQLEVREVYKISRVGTIAGCFVQEGKISRNAHIRVIRNGIVIFPVKENAVGEISSLKRFKEDVKEVKNGLECGLTIKNFNDIKAEDVIEAYEIIEVKQTYEG